MTHGHLVSTPPPPIVLLVEDDLDTRDMYHLALESEGFWVLDAPNASSALSSAVEVQPDLIVTDLGLPGTLDGVEFARSLRRNPRTADIPLLAVTGRDPRLLGDSAALFTEVLLKPVLPDVLIGRLRLTLAHSRELQRRSVEARDRVAELLERSQRTIEKSQRLYAVRGEQVFARPCPRCGKMLAWAERRAIFGITFDYYRPCESGCGLYCYNHSDRTLVALTE